MTTLPNGWAVAPFSELVVNHDGSRVPVKLSDRDGRPGPYPYYGASGVIDTIDDYLFDGTFLLVAEDGANLLSRSTPIAFQASGKFWVNNHAHVVQSRTGVLQSYLENYLNAAELAPHVTGTAQPKLTQKNLNALAIQLPPEHEQRRIVDKIEALNVKSRRAKEALDAIPPLLEKFRQSILAAAFRGDLTADWRAKNPNVEPASKLLKRIRTERRQRWETAELGKLRAKGKGPTNDRWKSKYEETAAVDTRGLPELPEGWCWASVGQLADVGTGATPQRGEPRYWDNGSIPWVTSGALNQRVVLKASELTTVAALEETNLTLYPRGTLLLAMYGEGKTRGKCALLEIQSTTNQAIAAIQVPDAFRSTRDVLLHFLNYSYTSTRAAAFGGVQPNLNLSMVRDLRVPLPPEEEQIQVCVRLVEQFNRVSRFHWLVSECDRVFATLEPAILAKAFRGELVPQDPNDEPASVLLERIRAEREAQSSETPKRKSKKRAHEPEAAE